ncbi:outer membrane protein [Bergeyella porcorum]|uniref:outer membrane protein n=1 Tax=Bergeyella porcorum TaxID=1735111 RepID=UPI0035EE2C4B
MKKVLLLGAVAIASFAFGQRVQKGETQLNAGLGLGNSWGGLPIYAGVDYGIHDDITIGAQASFANKTDKLTGGYEQKLNWFSVGANGNYHFNRLLNIPNNWDLYAGVSLVYNKVSYKDNVSNNLGIDISGDSSSFGLAGQVGARYYFTNNLGLNVEFGGGDFASGGKVGISYKF